ncbi:MAG: PIG-L family deacetylase [Thermoguttaceae bacterium]|nr:PIG-L family deacetylase [Thermoguttaceae bacterium]MDW8037505.1 PIG-L family deacetylase [Thermoguttaceae bacterium]
MEAERLDVIAVGAHPDDVEIACGGTLARLAEQGYRVGIVDLTDGEPTPECPSPEVRLAEAQKAAAVLGIHVRRTLDLPNRRLFDSFEARVALAKEFRRYRPRLVLAMGNKTPRASPDHYQSMLITEGAVFYSRLTKWDEYFDGLPVHQIARLLYYRLDLHSLGPEEPNRLVVDIGPYLERKLEALACYQSQFPASKQHLFRRIRAFNRQQGMAAGFEAGEVFISPTPLGTSNLMGFLFPS